MKLFTSLPYCLSSLCLALSGPLLLTSCDNQAGQTAVVVQEDVEAGQKAKAKLEAEIKLFRAEADKKQADLMKRNEELQKEADEAKAQFEKLQDEAAKARRDLEEYMAKYKLSYRGRLKGQTLPTLQTVDGQSYQSVVLREITPTEVSFAHGSGAARVAMEKLSPDLQRKFLYDPVEIQRLEEAKAAASASVEGLEGVEGIVNAPKDPNRKADPMVVHNLRNRIVNRQNDMKKARAEADRLRKEGYEATNLGKYRVQVLQKRVSQLEDDVRNLVLMLNKELNG